jgi:hypothetical protein
MRYLILCLCMYAQASTAAPSGFDVCFLRAVGAEFLQTYRAQGVPPDAVRSALATLADSEALTPSEFSEFIQGVLLAVDAPEDMPPESVRDIVYGMCVTTNT